MKIIRHSALLLLFFLIKPSFAETYFELDFDNGNQPSVLTPSPVWALPEMFSRNYGDGNFYEVTSEHANSGKYSLRFDYSGRNNFCNTCGFYRSVQKNGVDGVNFFVAEDGYDLTNTENNTIKKKKKQR